MKFKKLSLDFSMIKNKKELHEKMKELFGFPNFYGENIHALIDCLTSLRYPEDGMTKIHIDKDGAILLEVNNIKYDKESIELSNMLFAAIQFVNYRCKYLGDKPSIYLLLNQLND